MVSDQGVFWEANFLVIPNSFQFSSSLGKPPRQPLQQREELSYFKILKIRSFLYLHSLVLAWRRNGSAKILRERLLLQYVWPNQKQEILVRACLMRLPASSKAGLVLAASAKLWGGDAAEGSIWRWVKWQLDSKMCASGEGSGLLYIEHKSNRMNTQSKLALYSFF